MGSVCGERSDALVHVTRSLQSRAGSVLAAALMIALGLSALTWYYSHALTRQARARTAAQSATATRAQGEMPLPSLGPITPPSSNTEMVGAPDTAHPTPAALPAEVPLTEPAGAPGNWNAYAGSAGPGPSGAYQGQSLPPAKTPAELARERRLAGGVFARESGSGSALAPPPGAAGASGVARPAHEDVPGARQAPEAGDDALAVRLRPTATAAVQAQLLPTARFLLPKGAFIDCTLETAIDSTLPGMTTCVTAADTFGADGKVVLLERGSKLVGETRGQVQQGQARVFVVWTEVRTPTGVIVPLDSPGTDELGRAGLPGEVQRHFWERFGAAMLVSVVNGAVQAGVQAANHSGGAILYAPSTSQDVLTEALKDSVHIAPTVIKRNGDRIQVLVARDLDFRSVYELRTSAIGR